MNLKTRNLWQPAFLSTTVLVLAISAYSPPAHARHASFQGVAGLCAFTDGLSDQYFRIETNHDLIKGWETLKSSSFDAGDKTFYFGTSTLYPDDAPGSTLESKFLFPSDANPIKGSYVGTGDLAGVVVYYELIPDPTIPTAYPDLCNGGPVFFGYRMSGTVKKHKEK